MRYLAFTHEKNIDDLRKINDIQIWNTYLHKHPSSSRLDVTMTLWTNSVKITRPHRCEKTLDFFFFQTKESKLFSSFNLDAHSLSNCAVEFNSSMRTWEPRLSWSSAVAADYLVTLLEERNLWSDLSSIVFLWNQRKSESSLVHDILHLIVWHKR